MSANNGKPTANEVPMPESAAVDDEAEPELDQVLLNQVLQMGIPENPAKHALYKTGNSNADMAVGWYFENMEDQSINLPLRVKKAPSANASANKDAVPKDLLEMMMSMGFPEKKCVKALKSCDMNLERASDWLFSHMDDPESDGDSQMHNEEVAGASD